MIWIWIHLLPLQMCHERWTGLVPLRSPLLLLLLLLLLLHGQQPHSLLLLLELILILHIGLHSLGTATRVRRSRTTLASHTTHGAHIRIHGDVRGLLHVRSPGVLSHLSIIGLRGPGLTEALLLSCEHVSLGPLHHLLVTLDVALHHGLRIARVISILLAHAALHVAVLLRKHSLEEEYYQKMICEESCALIKRDFT